MLYKKKTRDAISRRNFIFQLATKLRKAHVQGKTAQLVAVLLPLFKNSQNSILDGSKKRKQSQVNVNCEKKLQNSILDAVGKFAESVQVV